MIWRTLEGMDPGVVAGWRLEGMDPEAIGNLEAVFRRRCYRMIQTMISLLLDDLEDVDVDCFDRCCDWSFLLTLLSIVPIDVVVDCSNQCCC